MRSLCHPPHEMIIIRKRGEERSIVLKGSEVDSGKKPRERGSVEYWKESGQRSAHYIYYVLVLTLL